MLSCGRISNMMLSDRVIHCDCGNFMDRDKNSTVNIMLRFLSYEPLVNGELLRTFLESLHRQIASLVVEAAMDSMEALPFKAG